MDINLKEIQVGDVFSEESHYVVTGVGSKDIRFKQLESGQEVALSNQYVKDLLKTSDQYTKEVKVTKEDKADGTLGIRSIFENLGSSDVFTVVFTKQGKAKTKKQLAEELQKQRETAVTLIDKAKSQKKSMAVAYNTALEFIQNNPVVDTIPGENRVLRGYKIQFTSRDGKYDCVDVDLKMNGDSAVRPVNINTITQLIVNGIKYVVA